ncbi:tripartite motif-containing protein 16-like isoform X2 [Polypterus senegalus]|uniref:tripartite motif-containing protein 16-like isoform X2 n=1 Tax=Polypterus senegalus TaxID=55291 RepID=UPI00196604CB|nr:tripartite motif-containing protein 16-like isoform X2 [Polypterus senegalus]
MAEAKYSISPNQLTCSVCLDTLNDPVTIPCGHNYCMNCIKSLWDREDATGLYRCPQCRMEFNRRPLLNRNALLAGLTGQLKVSTVGLSLPQAYGGPDDVLCDFCIGSNRGTATKTCVTCMINYCEMHLQPHMRVQALKRHQLEKPTGNLEQRICLKHQKMLEIFCRTDQTCICLMCALMEHRAHDTLQLENTKKDLKQKTQERMRDLEKLKMKVERIKDSAKAEIQQYEESFTFVVRSIQRLRSQIIEVIKEHEQRQVGMDEYRIKQLQKEIEELKGKDTELEELSKTDNHIDFLQKFSSKYVAFRYGLLPSIDVENDFLPGNLRKDLDLLISSLKETSCWEFVKTKTSGITPSYILENMMSKGVKRSALLKYKCQLTLDPNTAHRSLHLSETSKKVTLGSHMSYPDHPDRFEHLPQVLCRETLTGSRSYWEVEWTGNCIEIGVTCKGIGRKGKGNEGRLGCDKMSWSLCQSSSGWCVRHDNKETEIKAPNNNRIGVFLNWPAGTLALYSVSDTATLLHMFNAIFTEPLCPGFSLSSQYYINSAHIIIL